jgi:hypothetical protein
MKEYPMDVLTESTVEMIMNELRRLKSGQRITQTILAILLIGVVGVTIVVAMERRVGDPQRFQIVTNGNGDAVHRLDTLTGEMRIFIVRPTHMDLDSQLRYIDGTPASRPTEKSPRDASSPSRQGK